MHWIENGNRKVCVARKYLPKVLWWYFRSLFDDLKWRFIPPWTTHFQFVLFVLIGNATANLVASEWKIVIQPNWLESVGNRMAKRQMTFMELDNSNMQSACMQWSLFFNWHLLNSFAAIEIPWALMIRTVTMVCANRSGDWTQQKRKFEFEAQKWPI